MEEDFSNEAEAVSAFAASAKASLKNISNAVMAAQQQRVSNGGSGEAAASAARAAVAAAAAGEGEGLLGDAAAFDESDADAALLGDGICFYSATKREMLAKILGRGDGRKEHLLDDVRERCASPALRGYASRWGLADATFEWNDSGNGKGGSHCNNNNRGAVYDRFYEAFRALPETATLAVVFHGTAEANIPNILANGLDPSLRRVQAYGAGEYFSMEPGNSIGYCKLGRKMLAFLVVLPLSILTYAAPAEASSSSSAAAARSSGYFPASRPPDNIVVVPTPEHQLPIGVVSFTSVCSVARARSLETKARLSKLSMIVRQKVQQAEIAKLKAKIIQKLITNGAEVASEVYQKNKGGLDLQAKREIAMWVYRTLDSDIIPWYFPDLPEPMTGEEHTKSDEIRTVDTWEKAAAVAKRKLTEEGANSRFDADDDAQRRHHPTTTTSSSWLP